MLEYAPMLHVSYYAQNHAGIICQGLIRERGSVLYLGISQAIV